MNHNILQLCLSPALGGLELYVKRLASFLNENGGVTCVLNENGRLRDAFSEENLNFIEMEKPSIIYLISAAKKIARIIDENGIDVIHIHWTKDIPVAVLAKCFSRRNPKLVQSRHMAMTRFKGDPYHRFLYKNLDMMIAVTKAVQAQLEAFIPMEIRPTVETHYIGAGMPRVIADEERIALRKRYNLGHSFVVGIVGRIEEGKGQYLLIDAIRQLKSDGVDVKALIVGDAMSLDYLEQVRAGIKRDELGKDIIFTGFVNHAQELMQMCDAIVLATHNETFGLVLIEAMQCGVPVIGSNCGGPLEIIEDHQSGLLFESLNSRDLAAKIKYLIENADARMSLAEQGRQRALELFNEQNQFQEVVGVLEGLTG
ncbi:glycosyltransferase family 4 protein [Desulfoluna sp.]|uniref:glycosyltransferase family 4 protein n=1 Tax=Desulfoluna sp. TaxID=2045199 RepID=UPI00260606A5|nr:glycosyltransferase family 4 protein [Desulfoluna sp.]